MLVIQKVIGSKYKRIPSSIKLAGIKNGYETGSTLKVFQKGDTLYFTKKDEPKGFEFLQSAKVWFTQKKDFFGVPTEYCKNILKENSFVKIIYAKEGIFVKPAYLEDCNKYVY